MVVAARTEDWRLLIVPNRVPFSEMLSKVHYEGNSQVYNHRGTYRDERRIDKEQPDARGRDTQHFPKHRANSERISLKEMLDSHYCTIHNIAHILTFNFQKS